jgi:GT2 family glycosyltransferase
VLSATTYQNFEILVVDNGSSSDSTLAYLESKSGQGRIQVLRDPRPFNYSALNNAAVDATHGDMVCLLNDDTEVINGEWLDEMVGQLSQPGVGAVGAKLDFDDRRVQHGGVILGLGGVAGHAHRLIDARSSGYMGRLDVAQRFSAVTAACMLVRRDAWVQVGGLEEEHLAVAFNDVDFCLRLGKAGWSIVWTPVAELLHHESASRGSEKFRADEFAAEISYMQTNWERALLADPAYNPNLTLAPTDLPHDWSPAWPPRVSDS